jgi:hypothetical protein
MSERVSDGVLNALADIHLDNSEVHRMAVELRELRKQGENIALLAVTKACCEALGKQVQPAFIADEIAELRKRLSDAIETRAK